MSKGSYSPPLLSLNNPLERAIAAERTEVVKSLSLKYNMSSDRSFMNMIDSSFENERLEILNGPLATTQTYISFARLEYDKFTIATRSGREALAESLLLNGVDSNARNLNGAHFNALIEAVRFSELNIVELLLRYNASVGSSRFGMPLTIAACIGNLDIAESLISHGAKIFPCSFEAESSSALTSLEELSTSVAGDTILTVCLAPTPLYAACYHGHREMVEMLLNHGAAVDFPSPQP